MHLLATEPGLIADGSQTVDLAQTPGDIVMLASADTEIALLAAAQARRRQADPTAPRLRLAPVLRLGHNFSVDLYMPLVGAARLVVARLLGGSAYWPYGVERLCETCRDAGIPLALLPGDDKPDRELALLSTVRPEAWQRLWRYLAEGGPTNADNFLRYAGFLLREAPHPVPLPASGERERSCNSSPSSRVRGEGRGEGHQWAEPAPLLRAGYYWPGEALPGLADIAARWQRKPAPAEAGGAVVPIVFYRALVQSGNTAPVDALVDALMQRRLRPLPIFVHSLKEPEAAALIAAAVAAHPPAVILNATGFSLAAAGGDPLGADCPVLQVVFAGGDEQSWQSGTRGLGPRELAMNVALPEIDGRILSRAVSFKEPLGRDPETEADLVGYRPVADRVGFVADLARNWAKLRTKSAARRRIAIILANYPNRDGRIGNGVGLDTPQSAVRFLAALRQAGYDTGDLPDEAGALMARLLVGPTNARPAAPAAETLSFADYCAFFGSLPRGVQQQVNERWGPAERDPFFRPGRVDCGRFAIPGLWAGNVAVLIQPARGYNLDPKGSYHDPALVPPHSYFAAYAWLREAFRADAVIDLGKHGTLEWLPGKALALSAECFPEAVLGPLPHFYPFIVNDPGEGSQAKRRAQAVIVDHLTPPLTRAGSYGPQAELERLIDEYYDAARGDPRRIKPIAADILEQARSIGLDRDCGIAADDDLAAALQKLDGFLCELKELQIRDGLHVLGESPDGERLDALLLAIARARRGPRPEDESLLRSLAGDLDLGADPLLLDLGVAWTGPRPAPLADLPPPQPSPASGGGGSISGGPLPPPLAGEGRGGGTGWRTAGDTVERLETLALQLVSGARQPPGEWHRTQAVLAWIERTLRPAVAGSGAAETAAILAGLDGRAVIPGPSGAPSRGRPDVLPTGRNFYSVDTRAVPTPAAWQLGWHSAGLLVERYAQEHGNYPARLALSAWGTANMRTGGDDIAQALALLGVRPRWEAASGRVTGFEIMPATVLDRPRVDVTLRISGFFRDAFPGLIDLFDSAVRAVAALDEPPATNPLAARVAADRTRLAAAGVAPAEAERRAGYRIFGSKPGAYGAGLQTPIDERLWHDERDLADAYLAWSGWAYGAGGEGKPERSLFEARLAEIELVLHNQDNREHDLLDSDDYYQFEGGLALAVRHLSGRQPEIFHNDHSLPERPRIRTLREEVGRIVRGRAANPRWIAGVMRHGYKGAGEIAATVDYLFAFAATARVVDDAHFAALYDAYLADAAVRDFVATHNPAALAETRARFAEAIERGLWRPRRNSIRAELTGDE
ncbi:MAG: cobaltochelatase subunit CobN [Thiohalocapsa sp.]